jgi:SPP1 gp7 family putative phage head morphogenesis protein
MPTAKELKAKADAFDWDAWETKLRNAVEPHYARIAVEQADKDADRYGLEFDAKDPFIDRFFTDYLGEQITSITETTRERVKDIIQTAIEDGKTGELAERLQDAYAFSPARAATIARTETAIAYGHGAGLLYRQNGVQYVEISDGDSDEECDEADGQIWTVDEYLANPIAHPNCVRAAAPVLDDSNDEE